MTFLNKLHIRPVLFYGSLLGQHRDGGFIEGDYDIDFLVNENEMATLKRHINIKHIVGVGDYTPQTIPFVTLNFNMKGGVDFYMYRILNSHAYIEWNGGLMYPIEYMFPLKLYPVLSQQVYVPVEIEKILELTYGDGWKTPLKASEYEWESITKVHLVGKVQCPSTPNTLSFQGGRLRYNF